MKDETPKKDEPAKKEPAEKAAAAKPTFEVRTPNRLYQGSNYGIAFRDGVGHTDDDVRAHACLEGGYKVTRNGKPWPEPEDEASKDDGVKKK